MIFFPVIDDALTLQMQLTKLQSIISSRQGGQLTATQYELLQVINQRIDTSDVNQMQKLPVAPMPNLCNYRHARFECSS
jgi:hypothetical protein